MKQNSRLSRVDIQVTCLISILIILSITCVYLFNYSYSYGDMLNSLENQCTAIYNYLDDITKDEDFELINSREDFSTEEYISLKEELEQIREITGVRYLYTGKKNSDGVYVYLVDGLDSSAEDFRYPGDPIEEEVWADMEKALHGNIVLPNQILETSWGEVFVCYFPIHFKDGSVAGVLGIEIDASHQYRTYRIIRIGTVIIGIVLWLLSVLVSVILFRRISNPYYKDILNTDFLTHCKNRNAFEIDMNNMIQSNRQKNKMILSFDLNGLKKVNDTLGHQEGDEYIKTSARIIAECIGENGILYRTGGDEFFAWMNYLGEENAEAILENIFQQMEKENQSEKYHFELSLAAGYAAYDENLDKDLFDTYKRADMKMYDEKRKHYEEKSDAEQTPTNEDPEQQTIDEQLMG